MIVSLVSCKSILANPGKPLEDNSLKLGKRYEIQDYNAKMHDVNIISTDSINVYGFSKKGESIIINKRQIRQVKKVKVGASIITSILAIAAVILVPI